VIAGTKTAPRSAAISRRLALAALAAALLSLAAQPAGAGARPLVTGIAGIGNYKPDVFAQARSTGAQMTRLVLSWEDVAPKQRPASWQPENPADPNYNWSYVDTGVSEAVRAGLEPMLLVDGAPAWAQRCKAPAAVQDTNLCDPNPADLAAFAKAAAARYSGHFDGLPRVRYWQGLNEPNLSLFFWPQFEGDRAVSPYLYRALINAFYAAIKSVDPTDLVIAAGLGPIAVPKWTIGPMRFARELLCMHGGKDPRPTRGTCEGGVHFDIFDIHPYTTGGPTHEGGINDVELGDLAKLQTLLRAADRAGRISGTLPHTELWSSEFSWDSNPPDPGGLQMRILCRWTAEALYRSWSAGMSHFFWYSLEDEPPGSHSFSETLQAGLFFEGPKPGQGQPKEALSAFRFPFVAYPGGTGLSFWGRTPDSIGGRVAIQLFKRGRWQTVSVARADGSGIFRGKIHSGYGRDRRGAARAVYGGQPTLPFSMKPVPDFRQPPFG
jgi:hypothetical protein